MGIIGVGWLIFMLLVMYLLLVKNNEWFDEQLRNGRG